MNMDKALETFVEESRELLAAMEDALLTLETAPDDADAINAVFRAMHTIKGSAGMFGLEHIVAFAHVAESVMDRVRDNALRMDDQLAALLLGCEDHLATLIEGLADGHETMDADLATADAALVARLGGYLDPPPASEIVRSDAGAVILERMEGGRVENETWHISVRFGPDLLRNGYDPLSFVRYLGTLGEIIHVETVSDALPGAAEMDPETCYLGFEIRLATEADKTTIESAFEFVQADCTLTILSPHSQIGAYLQLIQNLPEDNARLGEILVACGSLTDRELAEGLLLQDVDNATDDDTPATLSTPPLGEILVRREVVRQEVVDAALDKQRRSREAKNREARVIRVDAAKLDELINLVGELVIAGAAAELLARRSRNRGLVEANTAVGGLVESIRDSALRLRMVEIGETFNRFRRVVRDVSQELGKDIELVITGAETELDKAVVERIGDPLMHLVRNAMDHGIEPAERRLQQGKPAQGAIRLNAYHESGSIVIEISDDGGGLNRERVLAKAVERGLVQPDQVLGEQEIDNLIFEPGFSTAEQVTNLSGRGVGMDVVRRNIDALRGTVSLDNRPGMGTTVSIRLPLTLAIIDGFLVGVGESAYIIPLDCVVECLRFETAAVGEGHDCLNLRGRVLPFLRLRELFKVGGQPTRRQNIVVIHYAGQQVGLVVDQLMGEFQTVIKPLGPLLSHLRGFFAGSTILGSGDVAMILDIHELIQVATQREGGFTSARGRASPAHSETDPSS
ncbi:chemotaxis protein CheA [Thiocystis violascens]|uniref:Chemotaxis protein CheA n=1 Tax=Thiocystis violascens (strain ATCC 17096 / DSM 198 / 6111) TaxID=765911 RepID=I3YG17_THIV6|nr:chemotaxis protein CheA [Thiocystis violascens]AFL75935.1 chemotaxis protein histidine kinase-like protein [Thiocystis violascens DSM 198]